MGKAEHLRTTDPTLRIGDRLMIAGGLALVLAGLASGEIFALLLSHVLNADLKATWLEIIGALPEMTAPEIHAGFDRLTAIASERAHAMTLHSHIGAYGVLAAALGILRSRLKLSDRFSGIEITLFFAGALLQSAAPFLAGFLATDSIVVIALGAALLCLSLAIILGKFMTRPRREDPAPAPHLQSLQFGAALVSCGLIFGLFIAWRHVMFEEPALARTLDELFQSLIRRSPDETALLLGDYRAGQSRIAITAAAHSHAVNFGFLLIIAAFLHPHLALSGRAWNWAWLLMAGGGFMLPVFVYLAPRLGYSFALLADAAGGLVLLGIAVALYGLLSRRSGT